LAPQMNVLVDVVDGKYVPSQYAIAAKAAGFKIITWTLERSGFLKQGKSNVGGPATNVGVTGYNGGGYYSTSNGGSDAYPVGTSTAATAGTMRQYFPTTKSITDNDGDAYEVLHMLATQVGIVGMFSDWPATVTFYANCILNAQKSKCHGPAKSTPGPDMSPTMAKFSTSRSPM
jgi:glycerophosphoryl diester phosphodiesterase